MYSCQFTIVLKQCENKTWFNLLFFFVICLFLLVHRRYNIKEVNLLITVYSIYTAYNLTKSRKQKKLQLTKHYSEWVT